MYLYINIYDLARRQTRGIGLHDTKRNETQVSIDEIKFLGKK